MGQGGLPVRPAGGREAERRHPGTHADRQRGQLDGVYAYFDRSFSGPIRLNYLVILAP